MNDWKIDNSYGLLGVWYANLYLYITLHMVKPKDALRVKEQVDNTHLLG